MNAKQIIKLFIQPEKACSLSNQEWQVLIRALRQEQLFARFALAFQPYLERITQPDLKPYLVRHLGNAITIANRQNHSVNFEVSEISQQLQQYDTSLIVLKGAAYSICKNKASLGRTYGDIDLLALKSDITAIEQQLAIYGWIGKEINDYDDNYYRQWSHEIPPLMHASRGSVIDLHHNLVLPVSGRAPNISLFTAGATKVNSLSVLRPAAMTLHSIIHLFMNEDFEHGLRNIHDIHLLISEYANDDFWQDILALASDSGFTLELYLATRYVEALFQTNIDKRVKQQLGTLHSNNIKNTYWDFIFNAALSPKHPLIMSSSLHFGLFLAYLRGHWQKMPVKTLISHLFIKSYRTLAETIFGKSFFVDRDKPL